MHATPIHARGGQRSGIARAARTATTPPQPATLAQTLPAALVEVALIDAPTAAAVGDVSLSWWHTEVASGRAPAPVLRRPRCTRWRLVDVATFWRGVGTTADADMATQAAQLRAPTFSQAGGAVMSSAARFEGSTRSQTASNDAASSWAAPESARPSAVITPALLTDDQSAEFLGVSVRRFHELRAQPWWTVRPVVLGPRLLRWPAAELLAAIASMPRQETKAAEPAALRRAKIERLKSGGRASAINKAEA